MGENSPERVLSQRMMAVAYEWHNYGKSTIGNRSDIERVPDRQPAGLLQEVLPARQRRAGRRRQVRRDEGARATSTSTSARCPSPTASSTPTYTEEPAAGRRAGRDAAPGRRRRRRRRCSTTSRPARTPSSPPSRCWPSILGSEPSGRLYKALVETKKASSVSVVARGPARSRDRSRSWPRSTPRTGRPREGPRRRCSRSSTRWPDGRHAGGGRPRPAADPQGPRARRCRSQPDRRRSSAKWAAQGDWRLYFLDRDRIEKVTPAQVKEVAARYLTAEQPDRRLLHPDRPSPSGRRSRRPPTSPSSSRATRAARSSRRAKRSTSRPRPSRPASSGPSRSRASRSPSCPRRPAASPSTCT